jgi:iron complex outermembrane recepter protein
MKKFNVKVRSSVSLFVLASMASTTAMAQDSGGGLEEILVTARRVEERLQDTPIAVTALSAATLEERQVCPPSAPMAQI